MKALKSFKKSFALTMVVGVFAIVLASCGGGGGGGSTPISPNPPLPVGIPDAPVINNPEWNKYASGTTELSVSLSLSSNSDSVFVNGVRKLGPGNTKTQATIKHDLTEGKNSFVAVAKNKDGKAGGSTEYEVILDNTPCDDLGLNRAIGAYTDSTPISVKLNRQLDCEVHVSVGGGGYQKVLNRSPTFTDSNFATVEVASYNQDLEPGSNVFLFRTIDRAGNSKDDPLTFTVNYTGSSNPCTAMWQDLAPTSGDAPLAINGQCLPTGGSSCKNQVCQYSWGDGSATYTDNGCDDGLREHTYSSTGSFSATCTVTGDGGTDDATQSILVNSGQTGLAEANFTASPSPATTDDEVTFDYGCTSNCNNITCELDFDGDNATDYTDSGCNDSPKPKHQFTQGDYTPRLTVINNVGPKTFSINLAVTAPSEKPTASFTIVPLSGPTGTNFSFDYDCQSNCDESNLVCKLEYENNGTTNYTDNDCDDTPSYVYPAGVHTAKLTISTSAGSNSYLQSVTIGSDSGNLATSSFGVTPSSGPSGTNYQFSYACLSNCTNMVCKVDYKNDGTDDYTDDGCDSPPAYVYSDGSWTAKLTITNGAGDNTYSQSIIAGGDNGGGSNSGSAPEYDDQFASNGLDGAFDDNGNIWTVTSSGIKKHSGSGTVQGSWSYSDISSSYANITPTGITFCHDKIYVADSNSDRVWGMHVLTGNPQIGPTAGSAVGLSGPSGMDCTGTNGKLYVADTGNNRIYVFDEVNGAADTSFGTNDLDNPTDVAVSGGYIFVSDYGNDRIVVYSSDYQVLATYSGIPNPTSVTAWEDNGKTIVAVTANNEEMKTLSYEGGSTLSLISTTSSTDDGNFNPYRLDNNGEGKLLAVDTLNEKINIFLIP